LLFFTSNKRDLKEEVKRKKKREGRGRERKMNGKNECDRFLLKFLKSILIF